MPSQHPAAPPAPPARAVRAVAVLASLSVTLGLALAWSLVRRPAPELNLQRALEDPQLRASVVAQLVERGGGWWDSHPDAAIGHILQPGARRTTRAGIELRANRFGLREREYALPKPDGTTRIVLLGDSYVHAAGVADGERMGRVLETELATRAGAAAPIEVLHIGIPSWDVVAACSFLRRQLDLLQPDLVVHFTVENDLDDLESVRGFGSLAPWGAAQPERAGALIQGRYAAQRLGFRSPSQLNAGEDLESRERYARAAGAIERLSAAVRARGGEYLLGLAWGADNAIAARQLTPGLDPTQVLLIAGGFSNEREHWVAPDDRHWNAAAQGRLARLLYGVLLRRSLLEQLRLPPWADAESEVGAIHEAGLAELALLEAHDRSGRPRADRVARLTEPADARAAGDDEGVHFHGGLWRDGSVSPYASIVLRNTPRGSLRLRGRCLDRGELDGARVEVWVEDSLAGSFELRRGRALEESWPLPEATAERAFVTVRLKAEDFVYAGDDLRRCVAFELDRIETAP